MRIIFVIALSLLFYSCKKERTIHVTATNVATGQRIPGLHYYLVELNSGTFGEKSKTIHEGDLDENGEAFITIKLKNTTHVIRVVEPDNNCYRENISLTFGPENFNADFKFAPCANLQRTITNLNCESENDKIEVFLSQFVNNSYGSGWVLMGCSGFIPSHYSSVPMGNYYFKWIVTRNGLSNTFYDTIYLEENSYTNYEINY